MADVKLPKFGGKTGGDDYNDRFEEFISIILSTILFGTKQKDFKATESKATINDKKKSLMGMIEDQNNKLNFIAKYLEEKKKQDDKDRDALSKSIFSSSSPEKTINEIIVTITSKGNLQALNDLVEFCQEVSKDGDKNVKHTLETIGAFTSLIDSIIALSEKLPSMAKIIMFNVKLSLMLATMLSATEYINDKKTIELKQKTIMLADTLERFEYWSSQDKLEKRLITYGYNITKGKLKEFESAAKRKKLSVKKAKQKIANGETVCYDDYPYCSQIRQYMEANGKEKMLMASRSSITNFSRIEKSVGISKLDILSPEEKFKAMGLKNFNRYRASFLMDCLKYIGVKCSYDKLSYNMVDELGCYAARWKTDPSGNPQGDIYMVVQLMKMKWNIAGESPVDDDELITSEYRISYQTGMKNRKLFGKTIYLRDAVVNGKKYFKELTGNLLYDWVCEDKKHRLPERKKGKDWMNLKHWGQTQISELYKDTDEEYPHKKESMEAIDCLIVDIDSGLTFSQFKERYSRWFWAAYPTINNVEDDWNKFRVIIPLRKTIKISGENVVAVVKLLRSMFCYFEDPCHQIPSYINYEDWKKRVTNFGERFYIPQEVVDDILMNIEKSKEFYNKKIDDKLKEEMVAKVEKIKIGRMSLDDAKKHFLKSFEEESGRHKALFYIKIRLSEKDRELFKDWLASDPKYSKYVQNWNTHKVR